ncbi:dUTP diphosphatase, partial [Lysinibacillus halotolerans]
MNLKKLFEAQRVLDEHIMNEHPELHESESNLDWKLLALQVELGECANEWRGFKKWSNDQKPRTEVLTVNPDKTHKNKPWIMRNLLLEEYVDCL